VNSFRLLLADGAIIQNVDVLTSPLAGVSGVILAILGARRRLSRPDGSSPTAGQQAASLAKVTTTRAVHTAAAVNRFGWSLGAGAAEVGGVGAAMAIRTASELSERVMTPIVETAVNGVTAAGGLVVDGFASIGDLLQAPFRSHPAAASR
jgi:hypothetical protein